MRNAWHLVFVVLLAVLTTLVLSEGTCPSDGDNAVYGGQTLLCLLPGHASPVLQQSPTDKLKKARDKDIKPPSQKKINRAIKKGTNWLLKQQNDDGSFKGGYGVNYPMGNTALCLLALLKSGVKRKHPVIKKGLKYAMELPLRKTYSVSVMIMALEAYSEPSEAEMKKLRKDSGTPPSPKEIEPDKRKWVTDAIEWLINNQHQNAWRYPTGGEDASNTQYALLGLNAAMRLKVEVPAIVFKKAADYFLRNQGSAKEEFKPPFRVPAADLGIEQLREIEKECYKRIAETPKIKKPTGKQAKKGPTTELVEEDPYRRFGIEEEKFKMFPRGWDYRGRARARENGITGSMTTAGVACLIICKLGLYGSAYWTSGYAQQINQAIRDGAAWIAKYFAVEHNPHQVQPASPTSLRTFHYYYLYGLERAGVLALVKLFGAHHWYAEGARFLLKEQNDDGSWACGTRTVSPANTCFALLFLKRATNPIISVPSAPGGPRGGSGSPYTGEDLFKKKEKKTDEQSKP